MKDCGIVKDLLPLYAEDLASGESAAFVKAHLEICEDCRKAYEEMKAPVEAEPAAPLKTVRKAVKKRGLLIAGLIACLVAALLFSAFARLIKPIAITSAEVAFEQTEIIPETIPLPAPQAEEPAETAVQEEEDPDLEAVKQAQSAIVVLTIEDGRSVEFRYVLLPDDAYMNADACVVSKPHSEAVFILEPPQSAESNGDAVAYVYSIPKDGETIGGAIEPDTVIEMTPKTLKLTPYRDTKLLIERTGSEVFVTAYTSLWDMRVRHGGQTHEIDLTDVDAVYFEPYSNTEHETLYLRNGYTPEAGFALPRLVMNYYFLIALIGTGALAVVWLVLLLLKKQKARHIFGILLLIPTSFVLAFLAAGFPATTIAPLRELLFVCIIALLLVGAGLCGRKLLRKE